MDKPIYRVFSVNQGSFTLHHIGDFDEKEDAEEAKYLDECDEPAPDKALYHSWHLTKIAPSLRLPRK